MADSLYQQKKTDSAFEVARKQTELSIQNIKNILANFITTQPNGTAVYFALSIARSYNTDEDYNRLVESSIKKFPSHPGLALMKLPPPQTDPNNDYANQGKELVGKPAPEISLPDTSVKLFRLTVLEVNGYW